jgi:hypothetical protein
MSDVTQKQFADLFAMVKKLEENDDKKTAEINQLKVNDDKRNCGNKSAQDAGCHLNETAAEWKLVQLGEACSMAAKLITYLNCKDSEKRKTLTKKYRIWDEHSERKLFNNDDEKKRWANCTCTKYTTYRNTNIPHSKKTNQLSSRNKEINCEM